MNKIIALVVLACFATVTFAQSGDFVKVLPAQRALSDSLKKQNEHPYIFPLFGKNLGKRGFMLPYPVGIMLNGYMGAQDVTISDLTVGINDANGNTVIPTIPLDDVVGFSNVSASVRNVNFRADLWVLPFLDVYGIVGAAWVTTDVGIGSIVGKPVDISTQANFNGYVYGIGGMLTGGIRSIFFSVDFNAVWTHFDELKNDNVAMNLAPRVGYVFHFNNDPEQNFSIWTGAGRVFLNNETVGSIPLSSIIPDITKAEWYNNLSDAQKNLVDRVIEKNKGDVINYTLNKRPSQNWCMILGAQFQLDRHWQFRTEANFLGGRKSGLISVNYRFGL